MWKRWSGLRLVFVQCVVWCSKLLGPLVDVEEMDEDLLLVDDRDLVFKCSSHGTC
jgi:hypothetical protein